MNILTYFCKYEPVAVIDVLYSLKLSIQKAVCDELKLYQLFRACILIDLIAEFLAQNSLNDYDAISFFVRDFVYFFGNIITTTKSDKLKLAACNYFFKFMQKILPNCAQHFQTHLNYVVSVLMPITKKSSTKIVNMAMELLNFLIIDQRNVLSKEIGRLDSFPAQPEFDNLREIQNQTKYEGKTFSLLDEMEYFLAVDKRKAEGLLSLKEHVRIF